MGSIVTEPPEIEVDYPEGIPMPEGYLHHRRRVELEWALRHWFDRRGDDVGAWVCCDINIYYKKGDINTVVAPDVAVAFGVDAAAQEAENTFRVWDAGAAPCFVLEVASRATVKADLEEKPDKYAELGVDEYWRFDPTGGDLLNPPLQGERRVSGRWAPIDVSPDGGGLRARSNVLGLDLCWQPPKLRLWDITERAWLPDDLTEQVDRAAAAEARASAATGRAAEAEGRAAAAEAGRAKEAAARKAAEAEIAELRARLDRALGEPGE